MLPLCWRYRLELLVNRRAHAQVPIYVLTTVGSAAAVRTALAALAKSAALRAELRAAGFQLSDAGLVSINSSLVRLRGSYLSELHPNSAMSHG
jgi:predicted membrane-bound mannosyltransferase